MYLFPRSPGSYLTQGHKGTSKEGAFAERRVYEVVRKDDVPNDGSVPVGRILLTIKNLKTQEEFCMACFAVQRHTDAEKISLSTNQRTSDKLPSALSLQYELRLAAYLPRRRFLLV